MEWDIKTLLSVGENVVYECAVVDEDDESEIKVYLTNSRIWINENFVDSRYLKFISKFGVFVGYEEYAEDTDYGTGEYGVYFGDFGNYESLWFYDEAIWKTFYLELSRGILEN